MAVKTMKHWLILLALFAPAPAFAQTTIDVNATDPCFLNYTAGPRMWENCGADRDFIQFALMPWEWATGGYFSMILVGIFVVFSYIKYHKAIYPIIIGILFLPISYYFFPETFINWAAILTAFAFAAIIYKIFTRQTKEY